jgi:hypothetical protein
MVAPMAKPTPAPAPELVEEEIYDDELSDEELEQASVGSLFSIQGPQFEDVSWSINRYRTRQELVMDPTGQKWDWVLDTVGELNGSDLLPQIGGGTFKIFGYRINEKGGVKLAYNRTVSLAGPRKNFAAVEPSPVQIMAPALTPQNDLLIKLIEKIDQRLERLERAPAPPPPPTSLKDMAETLVLLKSLDPKPEPTPPVQNPDREIVTAYMEILKQGIDLGRVREPIEEGGTDWAKVLETAGPLVERILTPRQRQRYAPPTGAAVPPQPPPAGGNPPPTEEDPAEAAERARWMTLVDALNRAITTREPAEDFADRVEQIMLEDEVTLLRMSNPEEIVTQLAANAGARYPVLATPGAKEYVAQVLRELNTPPSDDSEPPSA